MDDNNGDDNLSTECAIIENSASVSDLEDVAVLHRKRLGRLFAVVAIIWSVVLIVGFLGHAMLAAKLFVLLSGLMLFICYIGYEAIKCLRGK